MLKHLSASKSATHGKDALPPLIDEEDEEDLPPLVDTDNEEEEEDDELPPLVDEEEDEDELPPLVDTDNEEEGEEQPSINSSNIVVSSDHNSDEEDLPPLVDTDDEEEKASDELPPLVDTDNEEEEDEDLPPLVDTEEKASETGDELPPLVHNEEDEEDLPPLVDTDNEEEEEDDELPPLVDEEEDEDLPPLVDTDTDEEEDKQGSIKQQVITNNSSLKTQSDLPPLVDTDNEEEDLPPLVESTDEDEEEDNEDEWEDVENSDDEEDDELPPLDEDDDSEEEEDDELPPLVETTDEEGSEGLPELVDEDEMPPLEDDDSDLPDLIEDDSNSDDDSDSYHSGEDSDDEDFFKATQLRRSQKEPSSGIPETVKRTVPKNTEKNKKEWEEYKAKLEESKKRKENKKQRDEQKRQQLLQQQQQEPSSTPKVEVPPPPNEPQIEIIELGTCLFCNQSGRTITNKDDFYICTCSNKCKLNFHKECWLKYYRANRNNDRSITCPTEACGGYGEQLAYYEKLSETPKTTTLNAPVVSATTKSKKKSSNKETTKEQPSNENTVPQKKTRAAKQSASIPDSEPVSSNTDNLPAKQTKTSPNTVQQPTEPEPEEIKVVLSVGKFKKAVERKKFNDKALEETEKLKKDKLYKRIDFSIKTGYDIGIVIELEKPFGKVLTSTNTLKCRIENLQLGDLIQFQTLAGNEYAQNIELIERLQNVPQNFPELFAQLKEELKKLKESHGTNITFKVRQSKKKKATSTQPAKSKTSSQSAATLNIVKAESPQDTTTECSSSSSQEQIVARKLFELGDLEDDLISQYNYCLGEITGKKETFGKINVITHPSNMPEVENISNVFFHIKNFNKASILPNNGDKVLFFLSIQQQGSPNATNIHVVSNDLFEYLQFRLQEQE